MLKTILFSLIVFFIHPAVVQADSTCPRAQYASSEHKQLGDSGYKRACAKTDNPSTCEQTRFSRRDGVYSYSYGDLITLGDFFKNPIKAYEDATNVSQLEHVFECITKEGKALYKQKNHPEADYPDCNWVFISNVKDYLSLASSNDDHFAWNNVKAYIQYHEMALAIAIQAHKNQDQNLRNKALFINGVADHYLSDAFAAGHVQIPRTQIRNWVSQNIKSPFKRYIADAFAMILHDHDGKSRNGDEVGVTVLNARGDRWQTHSDYTLNQCREDSDLSIQLPIEAISLSISEVLSALHTGVIPQKTFAALQLVPFAATKTILPHYQLNGESKHDKKILKDLRNSLPLPLRVILSKNNLKKLMLNMFTFQEQLAQDVARDLESQPDLKSKMPQSYWEYFLSLDKK